MGRDREKRAQSKLFVCDAQLEGGGGDQYIRYLAYFDLFLCCVDFVVIVVVAAIF